MLQPGLVVKNVLHALRLSSARALQIALPPQHALVHTSQSSCQGWQTINAHRHNSIHTLANKYRQATCCTPAQSGPVPPPPALPLPAFSTAPSRGCCLLYSWLGAATLYKHSIEYNGAAAQLEHCGHPWPPKALAQCWSSTFVPPWGGPLHGTSSEFQLPYAHTRPVRQGIPEARGSAATAPHSRPAPWR